MFKRSNFLMVMGIILILIALLVACEPAKTPGPVMNNVEITPSKPILVYGIEYQYIWGNTYRIIDTSHNMICFGNSNDIQCERIK